MKKLIRTLTYFAIGIISLGASIKAEEKKSGGKVSFENVISATETIGILIGFLIVSLAITWLVRWPFPHTKSYINTLLIVTVIMACFIFVLPVYFFKS